MKREKNRYYPSIFCLGENIYIAVSKNPLIRDPITKKFPKVTAKQWKKADWLRYHEIDMFKLEEGKKVLCPVCGGLVDFRLWISASIPRIVNE